MILGPGAKGPGLNSRDSPALMTARRNLGLPAWGPARTTLMVTRLKVRRLVAVCYPLYFTMCGRETGSPAHRYPHTYSRCSHAPAWFGISPRFSYQFTQDGVSMLRACVCVIRRAAWRFGSQAAGSESQFLLDPAQAPAPLPGILDVRALRNGCGFGLG